MDNVFVESLTASLVREYMSRKGLLTTLRVLDEELPRTDDSVSNRQQLIKELHIEKFMKKNKEQSRPLKAMLEVITHSLVDGRPRSSVVKNGEVEPKTRALSGNSSKSSQLSFNFDGFPVTQDDDDPLAPDPRIAAMLKEQSKSSSKVNRGRPMSSDLVIEDSTEGETMLGQGKAGLMQLDNTDDQLPVQARVTTQTRPKSSKQRGLGFTGPVLSTEDTSRRKFQKPRPLSATKNPRLNLFDSKPVSVVSSSSSEKLSSTPVSIEVKPVSSTKSSKISQGNSKLEQIDSLISNPVSVRKSIKDVLDIEPNRPRTATRRQSSVEKETQHYSVEQSSIVEKRGVRKNSSSLGSHTSSSSSLTAKVGDIEMGDIDDDDLDQDLAKLDLAPRITSAKLRQTHINQKPIDVKTAVALKTLLFGTPMQNFNDEWRFQSFTFCDMPKLKYGLVQKKGGSCGVMAAVQASVLLELLFGDHKIPGSRYSDPTHEERSTALAIALAKVFWRAGEKRKAIVTIPSSRTLISGGGKFKTDDLIETLTLYTFSDFEELTNFMKQMVYQFEQDGHGGVVMSLYSVILSRKLPGVKEDMDEPTNKLMGAHGYCTQDMVNLYLSGRAVSNTFNDVMELDSGEGEDVMILKGLVSRCDVGLLSLFEHYNSCQVGTYLKTPRYPIWVVCSESHFSVLFSVKKDLTSDWKAERRFDLIYYDGLARQQEEIKLTIHTTDRGMKALSSKEDLVPPLEHCIRTKWEGAEVDWNGTEPLL